MRIIYPALVAATLVGSAFALGGCAGYYDGYDSSVRVGVYDGGGYYYHQPYRYWHHGYYY